ncbi:hypothetical protein BGZ46_003693, partial [Entomortierella lignicola]
STSKNQTTSATTTPEQTPRNSVQEPRPKEHNTMTIDQALDIAMRNFAPQENPRLT